METYWRGPSRFHSFRTSGGRPLATQLIIANVAAFVCQIALARIKPGFAEEFLMLSWGGLKAGYFWQPFTYLFLHGGLFHLLANMLGIYFAGRQVEQILGRRHFLIVYFAGGLAGGLAQIAASGGLVLGASAAVFALVLAFTTILPEMEIVLLLFFVIPLRMRAKMLAYIAIGTSVLFILLPTNDNIGHVAHLAGALVGYVFTRRLGYGNPLPWEHFMLRRKEEEIRRERMSAKEFISEEIDPILDKIARQGMHSLTRQERRILERGREKIERKTSVL